MDAAVRYHFGNVKDYEEYIIYNETVGAEEWGYEVIEWSLFYTTKILEGGIKKES